MNEIQQLRKFDPELGQERDIYPLIKEQQISAASKGISLDNPIINFMIREIYVSSQINNVTKLDANLVYLRPQDNLYYNAIYLRYSDGSSSTIYQASFQTKEQCEADLKSGIKSNGGCYVLFTGNTLPITEGTFQFTNLNDLSNSPQIAIFLAEYIPVENSNKLFLSKGAFLLQRSFIKDIEFSDNHYITLSGGSGPQDNNAHTTPYIYIGDKPRIYLHSHINYAGVLAICNFYDENKTFISTLVNTPNQTYSFDGLVQIPNNAVYARFSAYASDDHYVYIGQTVGLRQELNNTNEELAEQASDITTLKNIQTNLIIDGGYLKRQDGNIHQNDPNGQYTDFIDLSGITDIYLIASCVWLTCVAAFYDENKGFISSVTNPSQDYSVEYHFSGRVEIPQSAKFVRFGNYYSDRNDFLYCFNSAVFILETQQNEFAQLATKYNLHSIENIPVTTGGYLVKFSPGYIKQGDPNGRYTDYLPVTEATKLYVKSRSIYSTAIACFYDENKDFISSVANEDTSELIYLGFLQIPQGARFVRLGCYGTSFDFQFYFDKLASILGLVDEKINAIEIPDKNVLYGKTWFCCGDSFSFGDYKDAPDAAATKFQDGPYAGQNKVYSRFISLRNNMDLHLVARNGYTVGAWKDNYDPEVPSADATNFADFTGIASDWERTPPTYPYSWFWFELKQMFDWKQADNNIDYITFWFGINDSAKCNLGTINDTTVSTFYGAYNFALKYCIENWPFAHIGVIITNKCNETIKQAERTICQKWGIPYLDLEGNPQIPKISGICTGNDLCPIDPIVATRWTQRFTVAPTNGHPNQFAHELESTFIEHWMRSL